MRALDAERVKQTDDVVRQIGQGVRNPFSDADQVGRHDEFDIRRPVLVELGRQTDITIVEADDPIATGRESRAESVVPGDHLRRQAHNQHQRRRLGIAKRVVAQLDAVALDHGGRGVRSASAFRRDAFNRH